MSDSIDFFYSLFHIQYSKASNCFFLLGSTMIRLFISQILTGKKSPLEEKFFNPLVFEPESTLSHKTCKNKVTFITSKFYLNEIKLIYCRETVLIFDLMQRLLNRTLVLKR